jgi:preprotein translocase subunit SecA
LQAFAERDPRIAYKKEGYRFFQEMMAGIRDKVTDLIFRARIVGGAPEARSAYHVTEARHDVEGGYGVSETVAATEQSETAKAAGEVQGEGTKVKTIVREAPKVGRNDPCPCGSGKKYKKCCGRDAA